MAGLSLRERLEQIAEIHHPQDRPRLLAALLVGADIALARIREVGGAYASGSEVDRVIEELRATPVAPEPYAATAPPDDSPL